MKILGVIGGGFMARALVDGARAAGFLSAGEIVVAEPDAEKRAYFAEAGVSVTDDDRVAASCRYLLLAVKPQALPSVFEALSGVAIPHLVSILAGKTKASLRRALGAVRIARAMPNLPCGIGAGMTGLDAGEFEGEDRAFVRGLFASVGKVEEVGEALLPAVTAVSGSGPAYAFLFLKALAGAGVSLGMDEAQARAFAVQTLKGGAALAESDARPLDELIRAVSSKGGTTVAALEKLEEGEFSAVLGRAVKAAARRAEELSE